MDNNFKQTLRLATRGNGGAQYDVAGAYYSGNGVKKNYKKAVKWLQKSAEQGNADAQYLLAVCYENGYGVAYDQNTAMRLFNEAAENGSIAAKNALGINPVSEGTKIFFIPLWKKAESGNANSQFLLAGCYEDGNEAPKDIKKAVYWYEKSAEQGDVYAQHVLAGKYCLGIGVEKDLKKSIYWLTKAAENGLASAQQRLGERYMNGDGVPKDRKKAYEWLNKALEQFKKQSEEGTESAKSLAKTRAELVETLLRTLNYETSRSD